MEYNTHIHVINIYVFVFYLPISKVGGVFTLTWGSSAALSTSFITRYREKERREIQRDRGTSTYRKTKHRVIENKKDIYERDKQENRKTVIATQTKRTLSLSNTLTNTVCPGSIVTIVATSFKTSNRPP